MDQQQIILGYHSPEELEHIMKTASDMDDAGEGIQFLSGQFLGTGYAETSLIGDPNTREILVINLQGVDCMTFIEYMEAMRLSLSFPEFIANLKRVRYKSGVVDYYARNHFFTDWKELNTDFIEDVTERVAAKGTKKMLKKLNEKDDGALFLRGIQPVLREISYIPSKDIDQEVIDNLRAGDYIGIFSDLQGLDVSHTGIIVRHNDIVYFRHASSQAQYRQVTDQAFKEYIVRKPGIVVFRPKKQK
jgi:N-acetylmuramoyl-L-alanine amidase-like